MPTLPPELRRVPPDSFVATRDALSRRLRQDGDRDAAAEVRRLRRPSPSLWALNQLAEVAPDRVAELIRAGEALRTTTQAALQGGQAELGRLSSEHARLVEALTGQAMDILAGLPAPATREAHSRVWTMLRVASLDPDLAPDLAAGSLAEEPVSTGFDSLLGFEVGLAPGRAEAARPSPPATEPARGEPTRGEPARPEPAPRRSQRAEQLRAATDQVKSARTEAAHRRRRLDQARQRIAELRKELKTAEREAERLEHDLTGAEQEVDAAQQVLENLRAGGDR